MATEAHLRKTGFSKRGADTVLTALATPETVDWKAVLRRGDLSPRQVRTLRASGLTMAKLLKGGFTRHQATLILEEI